MRKHAPQVHKNFRDRQTKPSAPAPERNSSHGQRSPLVVSFGGVYPERERRAQDRRDIRTAEVAADRLAGLENRGARLAELRRLIREGRYETRWKLLLAADRLLDAFG